MADKNKTDKKRILELQKTIVEYSMSIRTLELERNKLLDELKTILESSK